MDKQYFKHWLKHRYIKTMYGSYVRIPENDDHLEFMVGNTVGFGNDSVYEVVMVDGKERKTWLTNRGYKNAVLPNIILDEMMRFVANDDIEIIDMYVVSEIASVNYELEEDLPF